MSERARAGSEGRGVACSGRQSRRCPPILSRGSAEFVADVHAKAAAAGFVVADRATWTVDHVIPQQAFDFSDPEDVKRCWAKENIQVLSPQANHEKSWLVFDDLCASVGADKYPAAWGGRLPTAEEKQQMYAGFRGREQAQAVSDASESEEGEEGDGAGPSGSVDLDDSDE